MSEILKREEIRQALGELRGKFSTLKGIVTKIILFGSTVEDNTLKFNDVDILLRFEKTHFESLKSELIGLIPSRALIIENAELSYSNHPRWENKGKLPFHMLLYTDESRLTQKVRLGLSSSIDITDLVFADEGIR